MDNRFPHVTVDGQPLPAEAIVFELSRLVKLYCRYMPEDKVRAEMPALRAKAVEQAIGARLLMDEAAQEDITVTAAEVDERLRDMRRQAGGAVKFRALLRKQGLAEDDMPEQIRRGRRVDKLVERIVSAAEEPTAAEVRTHFEKHRAEYCRAERAQVQHVLARLASDDPTGHAAAREKLAAIRARLQTGARFADEAAAHSDCPSGRQAGGSLGWVSRGMLVPTLDEATFSLAVGGLSEILHSPLGYHLLHKTDHEAAAEPDLDEVREQVREFLQHAARGAVLAAHVAKLRARAKIEISAPEAV